ncbi:MAG: HpcH/HpaI aldolase/citrate lyase family protein [Solirubrobacteraceae bacterium]|nr:HpcH/HpaI aldolase/citrate lyase family protein [Solirubrobacteraceae bacterium]
MTARPLTRFGHLSPEAREQLFERQPVAMRADASVQAVGAALGAVLYVPATTPRAGERLLSGYWPAVTAMVFCLEDAIADRDLPAAEQQVLELLQRVRDHVERAGSRESVPYLFVRVRDPEHLERLLVQWGGLASELDGVVLPKVGAERAAEFLTIVATAQRGRDRPLWGLPILEGADLAQRETRLDALLHLRAVIAEHRGLVPCLRIGATDLSGLYGLRRPRDFTIYDLAVVRDIIADIVNVLARDADAPPISGAVWEYVREPRVFKPRLRQTPFEDEFGESEGPEIRRRLLSGAIDGLLREALLDRANGLHGKTVIHPLHTLAVDAAYVVSHEEWQSADAIRAAREAGDGVTASPTGERMNEPKPHALWAHRTLARASAFGVLRADHTFLALLEQADGR